MAGKKRQQQPRQPGYPSVSLEMIAGQRARAMNESIPMLMNIVHGRRY